MPSLFPFRRDPRRAVATAVVVMATIAATSSCMFGASWAKLSEDYEADANDVDSGPRGEGGVDAPIPDADASADAAAEAARFCARVDAGYVHCSDYDDPNAPTDSVNKGGAAVEIKKGFGVSLPNSLVVRIPTLANGAEGFATQPKPFASQPKTVDLSFELRVETKIGGVASAVNGPGVSREGSPRHEVYLVFDPAGGEIHVVEQAEGSPAVVHPHAARFDLGAWHRIRLAISFTQQRFSLYVDGVLIDDNVSLATGSLTPAPTASYSAIGVGYTFGPTDPQAYHFDDSLIYATY